MKLLAALALTLAATLAHAAPAPYPLTINSRSETTQNAIAYRASESAFALTLTDGSTRMNLTGHTVWMSWATNANSATVSTSTVAIVSATNGTATATFSPAAVNYTPGRYIYEVGVSYAGTIRTVRHGVFELRGSPYATGADPITWSTNFNLGLLSIVGTFPLANLSGITSNEMDAATVAAFLASTGGTSDHAALDNLTWTASGHTGTAARLAGFFEGGAAGYSGPGAGLYFDGSDLLAVSNDIISGAAAGTVAQAWGDHSTNGYLQDFSTLTGADVSAAGGPTNAAAFATFAQGATADTAVQPSDFCAHLELMHDHVIHKACARICVSISGVHERPTHWRSDGNN